MHITQHDLSDAHFIESDRSLMACHQTRHIKKETGNLDPATTPKASRLTRPTNYRKRFVRPTKPSTVVRFQRPKAVWIHGVNVQCTLHIQQGSGVLKTVGVSSLPNWDVNWMITGHVLSVKFTQGRRGRLCNWTCQIVRDQPRGPSIYLASSELRYRLAKRLMIL
jgi:hypothetical protein